MIAVIVLNWNGGNDTVGCLRSLAQSTLPVHPVVVDNASTDGSVARIQSEFPDVDLLHLDNNYGYAGGNNRGIARAIEQGFDYICVLNNDTEVAPEAMEVLMHAADGRNVAVCPRIGYLGREGDWYVGATESEPFGIPTHDPRPPAHATTWETRFLTGCCILASAKIWATVGLFEESYFLIFEDSEWSIRAREAGVGLEVIGGASVSHRVSASLERAGGVGLYYYTRNALRFVWAGEHGRSIRSVVSLVLRPGVRDVLRNGSEGRRAWVIRCVSLAHAIRGRGGPAHGWTLARLGMAK